MASFATPADMVTYYDERRLKGLLSDSGTPVTDLENNAILLALLARATEEILAHALRGKKYSEDELQALADSETSGFYLVSICCDLAYGYLVSRRGISTTDVDRQAPAFKGALARLNDLAEGIEVFPRIEGEQHPDAGTPRTSDLTNRTTTPCSYVNRAFRTLLPSRPINPFGTGSCGGNC